jgi:hypothetical protein
MRQFFLWMPLLLIFSVTPALAQAPSEVRTQIKSTTPYGEGELRFLMLHAYTASLWTDAASWSYDAPFALSITYHMDFGRDELVARTLKEMDGQAALSDAERTRYETQLMQSFVDVKDGDRITATYAPSGMIRFYHNGRVTGTLKETAFARRFFDIWLSDKTSEPSLRKKLLKEPRA